MRLLARNVLRFCKTYPLRSDNVVMIPVWVFWFSRVQRFFNFGFSGVGAISKKAKLMASLRLKYGFRGLDKLISLYRTWIGEAVAALYVNNDRRWSWYYRSHGRAVPYIGRNDVKIEESRMRFSSMHLHLVLGGISASSPLISAVSRGRSRTSCLLLCLKVIDVAGIFNTLLSHEFPRKASANSNTAM